MIGRVVAAGPNRCAGNKCVDLCLPYPDDSTGGTYSCACKTGYKLLSDKTSCSDCKRLI